MKSLIVVFLSLLSTFHQQSDAQFTRACESYEDCVFSNETLGVSSPFNDPLVNLACDMGTGSCACRSAVVLNDNRPLWDLRWTKSECHIGPNGPCGLDNGLRLHCTGEFKCVDGRCRQEAQLRKLPQGTLCHDSIECQVPLECQMTLWHYFYTESKCLPLPPKDQEVNNQDYRTHSML